MERLKSKKQKTEPSWAARGVQRASADRPPTDRPPTDGGFVSRGAALSAGNTQRVPCIFFPSGKCRTGAKCKFSHEPPAGGWTGKDKRRREAAGRREAAEAAMDKSTANDVANAAAVAAFLDAAGQAGTDEGGGSGGGDEGRFARAAASRSDPSARETPLLETGPLEQCKNEPNLDAHVDANLDANFHEQSSLARVVSQGAAARISARVSAKAARTAKGEAAAAPPTPPREASPSEASPTKVLPTEVLPTEAPPREPPPPEAPLRPSGVAGVQIFTSGYYDF